MPFQSEKQRKWMWKNKPDMAQKWTDEHGSKPIKAGLGDLVSGLARRIFRKRGTARADSSQAKIMGDPEGKLLDHFKNRYSRQPIQAKKGKFQEFEHPQHNITPIEHMEEKVSSKERIERLLESRKAKKESKKKLVRAQEGQLIREKTRGTGAAVKGTDHYVMQGMDAAQEGKLIQVPTRGTGAAVKGTDHYVMQGMNAAKDGKYIKAKHGDFVPVANPHVDVAKYVDRITGKELEPERGRSRIKDSEEKVIKKKKKSSGPKSGVGKGPKAKGQKKSPEPLNPSKRRALRIQKEDIASGETAAAQAFMTRNLPYTGDIHGKKFKTGGPIKAKKGSYLTTDLKGYSHKKVSSKTSEKFFDLYKHRERGGFKEAKGYKKYLTSLGKMTKKSTSDHPSTFVRRRKQLAGFSSTFKDAIKTVGVFPHLTKAKDTSFVKRRLTLAGPSSLPGARALSVLKKVGKKTAIGKAVAAATVVAGAYEAGKRKLFTKDKKKKKVDKKSIGGETVVMKSGGGYIDDLL
jgi:uncharacterized Zn-binding protein involved in type VI secretion